MFALDAAIEKSSSCGIDLVGPAYLSLVPAGGHDGSKIMIAGQRRQMESTKTLRARLSP